MKKIIPFILHLSVCILALMLLMWISQWKAISISNVTFSSSPDELRPIALPFSENFVGRYTIGLNIDNATSSKQQFHIIPDDEVTAVKVKLMLFAFCYGIMELLFKRSWVIFIKSLTDRLFAFRGLFIVVLVTSYLILGNQLVEQTKIRKPVLAENQMLLNQLRPHLARQDFGRLKMNKSSDGSVLSVAGKRFENGLGTHANSQIDYWLPDNVKELDFMFGLDDEVESANVTFSVWGDDQLLWQSQPVYGAEKNLEAIKLSLKNIKRLSLRVSGNGDISNDHADWIQPTLTLNKN